MAQRSIFDQALLDEGILGTPLEPLARSIYAQESSSGKNPATSYAGATGGMQILPSTFNSVADQGWNINDPYANARAGIRYIKQGAQASGGDPRLISAYYYGGPGGMKNLSNGIAVGDRLNPNAPTTSQYADQVLARAGKLNTGNNMPPNPNDSSNPAILNQVMQPSQGEGILGKIGSRPGLSEALIGMGAGLLSGTGEQNPLSAGLSKGFAGFNSGYSTGVENAKARVVPIAGGAFSQITHPDGRVEIVPNTEAQRFLREQAILKGEVATNVASAKQANAPLTAAEQKLNDERVDASNGFKDTKASVDDLLTFGDTYKPGIGTQLAGTGVGKTVSDLISGQSPDAAKASQFQTKLSNVLTNKWLEIGSKLKGAQSDAEGRRLAGTLPSPTADYETVIKPWLKSYSEWLDGAEKRAQDKLDPSNRYPEGSPKNPTDNTGSKVAPPTPVEKGADLAPPAGTPQKEPKTIKLKNGTIVTVEE